MKFSVIFLGLFYVLNTLDVNIATIIAGLSVGGLALALAAQDTVKNFIASVMIFIDKPFKIGDTIKGDTFEGTVQEVGFRSTRIKTADDSLVYIANAKLSEMTIDNKGYRVFKKYKTEVSISYDTPLYKIEHFLEGIRTILLKYPYTKNSTIDVYLTNIQAAGLSITISYTYKVYNQREELQHREFILLQILRLADVLQIKLFEQSPLVLHNNNQVINPEASEDVNLKLEKFFTDLDTQVAARLK
jgi:MscS family membrane protein